MPIATLDQYLAAPKFEVDFFRTASRTAVAGQPFSVFDLAGSPGAGTLAVGNTAAGIVPTHAINGYPKFGSFGGLRGFVTGLDFGSTVACRVALYDCLFSAGAYAFNAGTVTLASQPSYAARVPAANYNGIELWIEAVAAFTGNLSVAITYTNQAGVTGRTTGTFNTGVALIVGRMMRVPLAAGDTGIQQITSITPSVATAGTFNVHVMRRLRSARVRVNNDGDVYDFLKTRNPEIFETSAIRVVVTPDGTATGQPEFKLEIALA